MASGVKGGFQQRFFKRNRGLFHASDSRSGALPIKCRKTSLGLAGLAWLFLAAQPVCAAHPDQPVTIVVPYPPGGPADLLARPLSAELQKVLGTHVVVQYKPGAGGQIALRHVANAKNDGYTLALVLAAYAIGPLLNKASDYDPVRSFEPVSLLAKQPLILYTRRSSTFSSVSELISHAKAFPGSVTMASSGYGNTSHLAAEMLAQATRTQLTHVPYHGGVQAVTAVMSGDVDAVFAGPDSLRYVAAGKLRPLAVASEARLTSAPNTPTFAEAGVRNMSVEGWYGILAPKGTPKVRIQKLSRAVEKVLSDASFKEPVSGLGFKIRYEGPSSFKAFIHSERERWASVIADRGLAID